MRNPLNPKTRWSEDEIQYLSENYGRITVKEIANILGRTPAAVEQQAVRCGFRVTDNFLTAKAVTKIMGVAPHTVRRWISRGYLKAKKSLVVKQSEHFAWHIEHKALENFIKNYSHLYDLRRISQDEHLYWRNLAEKHTPKNQVPNIARAWTAREDAFLLNNRRKFTYEELGEKLNRSKEAVHGRLVGLKNQGRLIPPSKQWANRNCGTEREWTLAEDTYLIENYRRLRQPGEKGWGKYITAEEIAKTLNRTKDGCMSRAYRLKITRTTKIAS